MATQLIQVQVPAAAPQTQALTTEMVVPVPYGTPQPAVMIDPALLAPTLAAVRNLGDSFITRRTLLKKVREGGNVLSGSYGNACLTPARVCRIADPQYHPCLSPTASQWKGSCPSWMPTASLH
jgi:hypothetical protein